MFNCPSGFWVAVRGGHLARLFAGFAVRGRKGKWPRELSRTRIDQPKSRSSKNGFMSKGLVDRSFGHEADHCEAFRAATLLA